mmetsp:Transcript_32339/g.23884  ORF Transcript_32339/g.23884 Transcript_32339/m.23884 type:complete len:94 (-) Transcript_32339:12-293(-)
MYDYEIFTKHGTADNSLITVEVVMIIPAFQSILYTPLVFEVLKFAWIQYFALFVLVYFILYWGFWGFVVKNRVFDCVEVNKVDVHKILLAKKS